MSSRSKRPSTRRKAPRSNYKQLNKVMFYGGLGVLLACVAGAIIF